MSTWLLRLYCNCDFSLSDELPTDYEDPAIQLYQLANAIISINH